MKKDFGKNIDWSFQAYGKLWNYNLQYFDYLFQRDISDTVKIQYLKDIITSLKNGDIRLDAYPVSLRIMNGIRYFSNKPCDKDIIISFYAQLEYLYCHLEYQILGNHLMENAFALFMGGHAFNNEKWKRRGKKLLCRELERQILPDGAHFELSPMYHKIILFRMLELMDWYGNIEKPDADFLAYIKNKATSMLNWLHTISLYENDIPYFNDSANNITYSNQQLFGFARQLNLPVPTTIDLKESGYRKFGKNKYQCVVDVGPIGASYQPGHAHADALSFVLYYEKMPFFVETATSTYQEGSVRNDERSTKAHNTVVVNDDNQSEVWASFRVGSRANVTIEFEQNNRIGASHDGYKRKYGITHQRNFIFENTKINIVDTLLNDKKCRGGKAYFHFHPDRNIILNNNCISIDDIARITFNEAQSVVLADYNFAVEFNSYKTG
ncbi:MAG: heparinase II/III family protein, partial [Prevotellaceae bacterium]|nr:heparinase II/III family protein [Prevotellaceae bacterium]